MNMRHLWRPRLPEVKVQCASCPFRKGNGRQFGVIVRKLANQWSTYVKIFCEPDTREARKKVKQDVARKGDFACHHTVYNDDMSHKDTSEFRQCPGATEYYRSQGEMP